MSLYNSSVFKPALAACCIVVATIVLSPVAFADVLSEKATRIATTTQKPSPAEIKQDRKDVGKLEKLPSRALEAKANGGDPLAGLALAYQLSDEAQSLTAAPVLANNAAEDAIRWYNLAARMAALQPTSISGMSTRPVRATRKRLR